MRVPSFQLNFSCLTASAALSLFACMPILTSAQANIAEARELELGASVTVNGIVSCGEEMGTLRYMQDGSAGIGLTLSGAELALGDSYSCTGVLADVSGLLVVEVASGTVLGTGNELTPVSIDAGAINENYEGQLVQLDGASFQNGGEAFNDIDDFSFLAGGWVGKMRPAPASNLIGMVIPSGDVTLTGIVTQASATGSGGYYVVSRNLPDVQSESGLTLGGVEQIDLASTSLTLTWATDQPASTTIEYGLTPDLGESAEGDGGVYFHEATIEGLAPGTMIYARAVSATAEFAAESQTGVYATVSESSGAIRVYFNSEIDETYATDEVAMYVDNDIVDTLAAYLGLAQSTLDIAVYNTNNDELVAAANAAHDAGVRVRWITEGQNANYGLDDLDAAIPVLERGDGGGSGMHNKFVIIDADQAQNAWVLTGSGNWTTGNLVSDCNNFIFFQDQSLARAYELEFEEMWGSDGDMYDASASLFGGDKTNNTPERFLIGGSPVELYFSPSDGTTAAIRKTILSADHRIEFEVFAFTRDELADAIIARHDAGCEAIGIIDDWFGTGTEFNTLNNAGVPTYEHQGIPGVLHHKLVIIDADYLEADPIVLTGSHNWSTNAESVNDENTVVVHDARVANLYRQEIWGRFDDINIGVFEREGQGNMHLHAWPNPSTGRLTLSDNNSVLRESSYWVHDNSGRQVASGTTTATGTITLTSLPAGHYTLSAASEVVHFTLID